MKKTYPIKQRVARWSILFMMAFAMPLFSTLGSMNLNAVAASKLTGTVTDENGAGMPGVTIAKKGTSSGANSDVNGKYSIDVNPGDVLVYSFVGYKSQEVKITNQSVLNIQLAVDAKSLEEIVVTGYGNQKKKDFLGSSSSIKSATIQEMPVVSVESAMQGRMTGVQVQQSSGQPGAGISIRVRGVTSIAGGNEPLFVIDGVPQYNNDNRAMNGMSSFNASDIESIEVLKDASATAIYGSRGANGVVQITTKSGKAGVSRVTYESTYTNQIIQRKLNLMNGVQIIDFG